MGYRSVSALRLAYFTLHREIWGCLPRIDARMFDESWLLAEYTSLVDYANDVAQGWPGERHDSR